MKEITDVRLIQQLMKIFELRELERETFTLQESVQPILDMGELAGDYKILTETVSITATGDIPFLVVPDDIALRIIYHLEWVEGNAGNHKVAFIGKHAGPPNGIAYKYYGTGAGGQADGDAIEFTTPMYLKAGERISVYVGAHTGVDPIRVTVDCKEYKRG